MTLTAEQLRQSVLEAGYPRVFSPFADESYHAPTSEWLLGDFATWFRSALYSLDLGTWVPESGDCDDFAALYSTLARVCHRRTAGSRGEALPVGVLFYCIGAVFNRGHAINIIMTSDLGLIAVDPQAPATIARLTAAERLSAGHIAF